MCSPDSGGDRQAPRSPGVLCDSALHPGRASLGQDLELGGGQGKRPRGGTLLQLGGGPGGSLQRSPARPCISQCWGGTSLTSYPLGLRVNLRVAVPSLVPEAECRGCLACRVVAVRKLAWLTPSQSGVSPGA